MVRGMPAQLYEAGLQKRTVLSSSTVWSRLGLRMTARPIGKRWLRSEEEPSATFALSKGCERAGAVRVANPHA